MNVKSFLQTLYVGDRGCKSITFDGWNKSVRVQVDTISRIRSASGAWNYYTEEDIDDGLIVFTDVAACELSNHGQLPNDQLNAIDVISEEDDGWYVVELSTLVRAGSLNPCGPLKHSPPMRGAAR
jgi:hypothetical protein